MGKPAKVFFFSLHKERYAKTLSNCSPVLILLTAVKLFKCLFCRLNEYFLVYKYFSTIRRILFLLSQLSISVVLKMRNNPHKVIPNQSFGVKLYLLTLLDSLSRGTTIYIILQVTLSYMYFEFQISKKHYIIDQK